MRNSSREDVFAVLSFYRRLSRPLTLIEIVRGVGGERMVNIAATLDALVAQGELTCDHGFYSLPGAGETAMSRTEQDFLLDRKWRRFLTRAKLLRHAPFVEAAFAGGSLALGNVSETSDFDLLIVVRPGRMFIARYGLLALALLWGVRRRTDDPARESDRFCLNHFVTRDTWSKKPHNEYRRELYRNLAPVWGNPTVIRSFIEANSWCGRTGWSQDDFRWQGGEASLFRKCAERLLGGSAGDFTERRIARPIAMRRLRRYLDRQISMNARIVVTDSELEFHLSLPYES